MPQDPTQRLLHQAQFLKSAQTVEQCPPDEGFEVAFAGRSNAGKSSAINRLTGQRSLARTSKTPGRTQLLNFFGVAGGGRFVDLPGYGYAKAAIRILTTCCGSIFKKALYSRNSQIYPQMV